MGDPNRWQDGRQSLASLVASVGLVLTSRNFLGESAIFLFTKPAFISIPVALSPATLTCS